MTFIPVNTQLLQAVNSNNVNKAEELLLSSDTKKELIINHVLQNGKEALVNLLPKFRSKGLVLNIKTLLDLE